MFENILSCSFFLHTEAGTLIKGTVQQDLCQLRNTKIISFEDFCGVPIFGKYLFSSEQIQNHPNTCRRIFENVAPTQCMYIIINVYIKICLLSGVI